MSAAAVEAGKENAGAVANASQPAPRAFSPGELKNMLGQCLKMASENKITPQNTWALPLIEHLPELIREEGGQQTNFQRASVTLDAGVKIYSYRVDSVHTETFKILGGLGRAANTADELEGAVYRRRAMAVGPALPDLIFGSCAGVLHMPVACTAKCTQHLTPQTHTQSLIPNHTAPQPATWATAAWAATARRQPGGGAAHTN